MEIEEKDNIDPRDKQPAILDLPNDKIKLLEKRGLFPTPSGLIDDTYYLHRKNLTRHTHVGDWLSVQQLIDMPYDEMEKVLFMKDSMIPMEVCFYFENSRWGDSFGRHQEFYDVEPFCLEPYVAKYVRAINRCGMETFYSCDGWHEKPGKSREIVILFRDRYSWIWHKLICGLVNIDEYCSWKYEGNGSELVARIRLPREDNRKLQIYSRLLSAASVFIYYSKSIKKLKKYVLGIIDGDEIDLLSDSGVEKKLEGCICSHIQNIG